MVARQGSLTLGQYWLIHSKQRSIWLAPPSSLGNKQGRSETYGRSDFTDDFLFLSIMNCFHTICGYKTNYTKINWK